MMMIKASVISSSISENAPRWLEAGNCERQRRRCAMFHGFSDGVATQTCIARNRPDSNRDLAEGLSYDLTSKWGPAIFRLSPHAIRMVKPPSIVKVSPVM